MNAKTLLTLVLFATLLTFGSRTAHAAVMSRDWKTPGDGLLTYDDVNQREWLDLSETVLVKFGASMVDPEGAYQNVVSETTSGGMFLGFAPATSDDVIALAQSAGIDTNSLNFATNRIETRNLINLLAPTFLGSNSATSTTGLLDEVTDTSSINDSVRLVAAIGITPTDDLAGLRIRPSSDISPEILPTTVGVWLVRSVVPEPSSLFLVSGLVICTLLRR